MKTANTYSSLEKTVFITGLIIILGLLGYLIFQSFSDKNTTVKLEIEISKTTQSDCSFKAIIKNKGETTAETVNIAFDLYHAGKPIESVSSTIDYIPSHSQKILHIVFRKKKTCDSLVTTSTTYLKP